MPPYLMARLRRPPELGMPYVRPGRALGERNVQGQVPNIDMDLQPVLMHLRVASKRI